MSGGKKSMASSMHKDGDTKPPETGKDSLTGRFTSGNQLWESRSTHGRKPIFKDPSDLMDACQQYFVWIRENPLYGAELVKFKGKATIKSIPKMHVMTEDGLCIFLDISNSCWQDYKLKPDFLGVTRAVEATIREQKMAGASAELLNPNIIARDLGLKDRRDVTSDDEPLSITLSPIADEE